MLAALLFSLLLASSSVALPIIKSQRAVDPLERANFAVLAVDVPFMKRDGLAPASLKERDVRAQKAPARRAEIHLPSRYIARQQAENNAKRSNNLVARSEGLTVPVTLAPQSPILGQELDNVVASAPAVPVVPTTTVDPYSWAPATASPTSTTRDIYSWSWPAGPTATPAGSIAPLSTTSVVAAPTAEPVAPAAPVEDDIEWESCLLGEPDCEEIPDDA